jgi:flagellar biosynthesis GTPase FlhF
MNLSNCSKNVNSNNNNIIDRINDEFSIPIFYNVEKKEIKDNIVKDLELINTIDDTLNPIYSLYCNTDNDVSKKITEQISKYYTTDITFLKETQKLIKEYTPLQNKYTRESPNYKKIIDIWNELKMDVGFREKYYYVEWEKIEFLNRNESFLQFVSIYNMFSPIFSLILPIIILFIPFIIIKAQGLNVSLNEYINVLKVVSKSHSLGRFFTMDFKNTTFQEKIYSALSICFYMFSVYQNVTTCLKFHDNMKKIHIHFENICEYLDRTIKTMQNYLNLTEEFTLYTDFNKLLLTKMDILQHLKNKLSSISKYSINCRKITEYGTVFKYFYELHTDETYNSTILYSLGFNGYIDCIEGIQENILKKKINFASLQKPEMKKRNKSILKKSYYPACFKNENDILVKNTVKLKKNMIITGPNASGKTTILKSTLINVIFTQQFGCGYYDSAKFAPFHHIHSYLNIPDTSGRDSLFQAEARRCKEILDCIDKNSKESHFCVFDELYSGTNPEEAEISAASFMLYLQKYKLVSSILTTHFFKVCKTLDKVETIENFKMETHTDENKDIIYTYKLNKGISEIKGGINVLNKLNYPKEIIDGTLKM